MLAAEVQATWIPPLHQIEKWWDEQTLRTLSRAMRAINGIEKSTSENVADLLKVAFCRMMIERANVSFRHQSMSFKKNPISGIPIWQISENETILSSG